jgi:hypothetical protein
MVGGRGLATALVAAVLCAASAQDAAAQSCPDSGDVRYVCGVNNPEDLLRVDGTPFVLTGNMGDTNGEGGGFYSVDVRTREVRVVRPAFSSPAHGAYRGCPGPPEPGRFSVHGIDLKTERPGAAAQPVRTVYAVNHGGRESIEVFRLEVSGTGIALTWIGCALLPESHAANSVAALGDGGFAATVPVRSEEELVDAGLGRPTGAVLRWSPAEGWRPLPDVELSFPNGILASPDGAWLYVAGYTEQAVARLSLATGATAAKVDVPFNPDNLRWAPDGGILATGQNAEPAVVELTCVRSSTQTCQVPTGVSRIEPGTLRATTLLERAGDERFGAGTSAIVVGEELWIGSFRAQRLLRVPRRALAAPVGREADGGSPGLRLVRRCAGGRLRAELRGDLDRVRDVSFKFGRRLIARDTAAPFRRLLPRRALRATRARRLRAVAYLRDGRPFRMILGRSLPRCGA